MKKNLYGIIKSKIKFSKYVVIMFKIIIVSLWNIMVMKAFLLHVTVVNLMFI